MAAYQNIRSNIETGDIVLFSGKGGISAGIKWFTQCDWSHVGMALRLPEWNLVLLWESTTLSNIKDLESGIARKGVQLVPLSERMKGYKGEVAIRHLKIQRTPEMLQKLGEFRETVKGRKYEEDKIELIKAAYEGPFGQNVEDLSTLFCSELIAETYQRIGLLSEEKPSNEFTPRDFSEKADPKLSLLDGQLTEEIRVTV
jgi:hypothetical protein